MRDVGNDPGIELNVSVWDAFTNEATVSEQYLYFSSVADVEHFSEIGGALREMAESLSCVAHGHFDGLRYDVDLVSGLPYGDTEQNLASAIHVAATDASVRYVQMRQLARDAGLEDLVSWLDTVIALKRHHAERLDAMLREIRQRDSHAVVGPSADPQTE